MTIPRTVAIGDTLDLEAGAFTIAGYGNGVFRLRDDLTNQYELIHHTELSRLLPPGQATDTNSKSVAESTLSEAMAGLTDEARFLIPHLQELVDGSPAVGDVPREQYALGIPMGTRLLSKWKELTDGGFDISPDTLKRRMQRYRKAGVESLVDGRSVRRQTALGRADKRVTDALAEVIAGYVGRSSPSYTRVRVELKQLLLTQYPNPEARPSVPSLSTVKRYVAALDGENPTTPARRRETNALAPTRQHKPRLVSAPGDECQIDTTVFDAFVRLPDGKVSRPFLTILIDKRTRSIIAFNFTADAPTGYDHAVLLANALVPRKLRSWHTHYDTLSLPRMPWSEYLDEEQLKEYDTFRPYIFPRRIITDNGQDYKSTVFRLACDRYGIHLTEAPLKAPTSKAHVERHFSTVNTMFAQYLPGYVHSNVQSRGENAGKENVLKLEEVAELFDRWLAIIWQNRRHDGLVDHLQPNLRHTPNTMFAASVELQGHFVVPCAEDDFIALMPSVERTIQNDGIELNGRMYDSPHLAAQRGIRNSDGSKKKFAVHFDPADITRAWARVDTEWVMCTWVAKDGMSRPLERTLNEIAHRLTTANTGFKNDEADELMVRLRDEFVAQQEAEAEARVAAAKAEAAKVKSSDVLENVRAGNGDDSFDNPMDLTVG
ncbi:Mu transposase C-terminal domain-containing protein [Microbacterium hydrocarbonoxydans]|uniref:Mu transposase C-terminal domain-containing protein n=1 Tax=Microbacterium hydrocarbonoxydans TaxID=273678 RepID=UPI002041A9B3|nr:Mu transposase C-terminal domain-containing protein [Microbacterium hydrocarbonoxydans]MCM3778803.1 Mu transposase C-terminal domain-containing protein [Microbacterium hydrocarbonoxydans]